MDSEFRELEPHRVTGEGGNGVDGVEGVDGDAVFGCVEVVRAGVGEVENALADGGVEEADTHGCCVAGATWLNGIEIVRYLDEPLEGFEDAAEEGSC